MGRSDIEPALNAMKRLLDHNYRYASPDGVYDDLRTADRVLRNLVQLAIDNELIDGVEKTAQDVIKERVKSDGE